MGISASKVSKTVGLMGFDDSQCADLISPHRFMGLETKGLICW